LIAKQKQKKKKNDKNQKVSNVAHIAPTPGISRSMFCPQEIWCATETQVEKYIYELLTQRKNSSIHQYPVL
jgi:hypothetical protein